MNARRGPPPRQSRTTARVRRWLPLVMLALNLAGIAAIGWLTDDPNHVALGVVPLSLLMATFP